MVKLTDITFNDDWVYAHAYDCTHGIVCDMKVHRKKKKFLSQWMKCIRLVVQQSK